MYLYHNLQNPLTVLNNDLLKLKLIPDINTNSGTSINNDKDWNLIGTYEVPLQKHVWISITLIAASPLKKI